MKKLLVIALFSIAIMAFTTAKKEIVTNNSKEINVEINDASSEFKIEKSDIKMEIVQNQLGCGEQGNAKYHTWREQGISHRDARTLRRTFVRKCRGGTWAWLKIGIGEVGITF